MGWDDFGAWIEMLPPSQREELRATWTEMLKDWWDKTPNDQKDKMISTLKLPIKSKNEEWSKINAWWN